MSLYFHQPLPAIYRTFSNECRQLTPVGLATPATHGNFRHFQFTAHCGRYHKTSFILIRTSKLWSLLDSPLDLII